MQIIQIFLKTLINRVNLGAGKIRIFEKINSRVEINSMYIRHVLFILCEDENKNFP